MEIIAGDDVKAKSIGKSGDFQVGGVIRDDSIVSIMSMDYEGCCFQGESMETQRQGHGAVDYYYDYGGDVSSANFDIWQTGICARWNWNVCDHWKASWAINWRLRQDGESGGKGGWISTLASSLLWVSDVPEGSSGQEESSQTTVESQGN